MLSKLCVLTKRGALDIQFIPLRVRLVPFRAVPGSAPGFRLCRAEKTLFTSKLDITLANRGKANFRFQYGKALPMLLAGIRTDLFTFDAILAIGGWEEIFVRPLGVHPPLDGITFLEVFLRKLCFVLANCCANLGSRTSFGHTVGGLGTALFLTRMCLPFLGYTKKGVFTVVCT